MKHRKSSIYLALLATICIGAIPLAQTGCGTLDPAGAYKGDKTLYDADLTITTAYDTVHSVVLWEYQNRAAVATLSPAIRPAVDGIRKQAPQAFAAVLAVRDAYAAASTATNATALGTALTSLQAIVTQAEGYLTTPGAPPAPAITPATIATVKANVAAIVPFTTTTTK